MSQRNPQNERYTVERDGRAPGSTKPKAGSAKPASKAAASVHIQTSKSSMTKRQKAVAETTMTKEEKKARRAKEREEENMVYTAITELTNKDEKYKKLRRIWWALLISAVVFTALSWVTLSTGAGGQVLSIVTLVLAYAGIIGALIMDFTVIRKRRNVFRDKVNAMTKKQVERIVEEAFLERTAADEGKKAAKEARKAGKSKEEQEAARKAAAEEVLASGKAKRAAADAAEEAEDAAKAAKAKGKAAKGGKDKAAKAGTTKVTEVTEGAESAPADGEPAAEAASAAEDAAEAEEARKAAAAKAAREFAASKGHL